MIRTYISGMSATTDFAAAADAGLPIGVQIQEVSTPVMAQIAEYTNNGGQVFIDSGAFKAFTKGATVDFASVLLDYEKLAAMTRHPENLAVVAPDVIGDQDASAALQLNYLPALVRLAQTGVEILVPFQRGWQTDAYADHYRTLENALGGFTLAFAANKAAWSPADVARLVSAVKPVRVHLLGVGTKNLDAYSDAVLWNSPSTLLSSDANRTRVFLGKGRPITEGTKDLVAIIRKEEAADIDACFDDTEFAWEIHNLPGFLQPAEARELAHIFGITDEAEIARWGRLSQDEASARYQDAQAVWCDFTFGSKLGYLIHKADLHGLKSQAIISGRRCDDLKDMLAILATKRRQKDVRRSVISKTLTIDSAKRERAYRAKTDQMLLFAA